VAIRSVWLAYVVPPVLAVVLGFLGCLQVSQAGVVGVSSVVTTAADSGSVSSGRVAASLERVARAHDATVVRTVADRSAPTSRRTVLVTGAPGTRGAAWLQHGYRQFDTSITTTVRSMAALDRYDPSGAYEVIGDEQARRATERALVADGFDTTSETLAFLARIGVTEGVEGTVGLVGALMLGCVTLCLVGTIGAPRRTAVQGLHGRNTWSVVLTEVAEVRATFAVVAVIGPVVALFLWFHNGLAAWTTFTASAAVFCAALLVPVVVSHALGTVIVSRRPIAATLRGARTSGGLVLVAHAARVPAVLLLVAAVFDLSAAVAVERSGSAERDRRAAGETVQLWVTPDPRPGSDTQQYWDRIGAFAGRALDQHRALLSAAVEVSTGTGTVPALIVDSEYLRLQDLRTADGERITATDDEITVWTPDGSDRSRAALLRALTDWELRGASREQQRHLGGGELGSSEVYAYPGDASSRAWLTDVLVVVVPDPARVFTTDQLGAWLSTGNVVFRSEAAAVRAIASSGLEDDLSAVVPVGQAAAEQQRDAAAAVWASALAVVSSFSVAVVLATLGVVAHHRRHGRQLFAEFTAGTALLRADRGLLVVEAFLATVGAAVAMERWWQRRPDGTGAVSALDPVSDTIGAAGASSALLLAALSVLGMVVIARSRRTVVRDRGAGS
jgi:hypothetical protein